MARNFLNDLTEVDSEIVDGLVSGVASCLFIHSVSGAP